MHFEQTRAWARFQQILGRRVYTFSASGLILYNESQYAGGGVVVERKILGPFNYLEANRLILSREKPFLDDEKILHDAGVRVNAVFVRWTPAREITNYKLSPPQRDPAMAGQITNLKDVDIVEPAVMVRQVPPKATLVLDLERNEDDLLGGMHEKARYNIRLAMRKGVEVREAGVQDGFEKFWHLMQETAVRDAIGIHTKEYYKKMLETVRGADVQAHLFLAENGGVSLATAVLIICGDTATYLHGGSSGIQRNMMAPYALQWSMMLYAQAQGCRWYDMWGIASPVESHKSKVTSLDSHPWAGITRFKMGFGGEAQEGDGTFDIICKPLTYRLLSLGRYIKNLNH